MIVMLIPSHPAYFLCMVASSSGSYATALMAVLNSRVKYTINCQPTWNDRQSDVEISASRSGPGNPLRHRAPTGITRPGKVSLVVDQDSHPMDNNPTFDIQLTDVKHRVSDP